MNTWRWFATAVAVALAWTGTATATVVIEKDLDDIAREADMVFVGRVISVESRWRDDKRSSIETVVTFHVVEALHGIDRRQVALAFAGGELDGLSEVVAGMPEFRAGEEVVLFASRKPSISPVIGFNQGCFRIEGGRVLTSEKAPVSGTSERGLRLGAEGEPGMPLGEFLDDVRRRLERRGGGDS